MKKISRRLLSSLLIASGFVPMASFANDAKFPSKPIKIIIVFTAGGSTDIPFRVLAENASKILGQPVLIENKAGAGGVLPAQIMQSTTPDGYTLAQVPLPVFRLPYTTKLNWDPVKDLTYVISLAGYSFGLVVPADSPIKDMQGYLKYAKENPGKLTYATPGSLTTLHLTMEAMAVQADVKLNHVPYKGNSESLQAVMGGHVMSVADTPGWGPYVDNGKLRLLSTWGNNRSKKFPNAPTLKESGIDLVQVSPFGLVLPKGAAPDVVKELHDGFKKAMEMPNFQEALAKFDMEPYYMSSADYRRYAEETIKSERNIIYKLGLEKK
jgi:tripartite-type tricarboxylate transporter receptor subunit TctC